MRVPLASRRPASWRAPPYAAVARAGGAAEKEQVRFNRTGSASEQLMARAEDGNYYCSVKLFNETEVDTGLRDIKEVFMDDSGTHVKTDVPQMSDSRNIDMDSDVLNLPACQWVNAKLYGRFGPEEFEVLARSTSVGQRAYLPKDRPCGRQIPRMWE